MPQDAAEEALAHCHISTLLARYYHAVDSGDLAMLERDVLAAEAVWEVVQRSPSQGTVEDTVAGREQVIAWFRQILGGDASMSEGACRHFISTHAITVDGDRARSTSHLQAVHTKTLAMLSNGVVHAGHVRTADGWRIQRYRIEEDITDADMRAYRQAVGR